MAFFVVLPNNGKVVRKNGLNFLLNLGQRKDRVIFVWNTFKMAKNVTKCYISAYLPIKRFKVAKSKVLRLYC